MKTDNVFKFMTVRSPVPTNEGNPFFPRGPEYAFDPGLLEPNQPTHLNIVGPSMVRRDQGRAIVESEEYFANDASWAKLRIYEAKARELIVQEIPDPDANRYQNHAGALFSEALGSTNVMARLLTAPKYLKMWRSMWISYYATILAPDLRPQHRKELVTWIIFFHLAELSVNQPDRFMQVAAHPWRVRPAVPLNFYRSTQVEDTPTETTSTTESSADKERVALSADLALLKSAKDFVEKIYNTKLRRFQKLQLKGESVASARDGVANQGVTGANLLEYAPWRMQEDDFEPNKQLLETLTEISLDPTTRSVPDLLYSIDERLAYTEAKLFRLGKISQVVGAGKALVRISRPAVDPGLGG
jgi:hypothetical protein